MTKVNVVKKRASNPTIIMMGLTLLVLMIIVLGQNQFFFNLRPRDSFITSSPRHAINHLNSHEGSSKSIISCDRSHYFYDICSINGSTVFDPIESTFYDTESTKLNETNILIEKIKPYPRKWENFTMGQIKEFTLTTGPIGPHCLIHHKAQALVFSVGGYTGNFFHDINDGFLPLFITVNSLFPNQDFILVISKLQDWWVQKYKDLLQSFSKYPIINIDKEINVTHCFPRVTLGLVSHGFMNIDPKLTPNSKTLIDFHNFLATTYDEGQSHSHSYPHSDQPDQSQLQYQSQSQPQPQSQPQLQYQHQHQSQSQPDQLQPQPQPQLQHQSQLRPRLVLASREGSVGRLICREIEGPYLDALSKQSDKPFWGLGPFNPVHIDGGGGDGCKRHRCIEWLDKQPLNSVIFVSFGTASTFSPEQIHEIAIGLDRSEQKFIWVLREADKKGKSFTGVIPKIELPIGFEERVAERGIIAREWVPQLEILAHPSTGGYLFHSGWNSFLESATMGVPMATWPINADNPYNDVLITKVLKVGLVVRDWKHKDELVKSDTIEIAVRTLMNSPEGEEMRQRATELSKAIKTSVGDGGSTQKQMDSFIAHITR